MGVLKKLTDEYFGKIERTEDELDLPEEIADDVKRKRFIDKNGNQHYGFYVVDGSLGVLNALVNKLIEIRGDNCDLNDIYTANIKDMAFLFRQNDWMDNYSIDNSSFNGDISGWDVSQVESMEGMFTDSQFNGDISKWDVSSVTCMYQMFMGSSFDRDLSGWEDKVSKLKEVGDMFCDCPVEGNDKIPSWWYEASSREIDGE